MNDMPDERWSAETEHLANVIGTDIMGPPLDMLDGWVAQAKARGWSDEQARFIVLHQVGYRPVPPPAQADDGESDGSER